MRRKTIVGVVCAAAALTVLIALLASLPPASSPRAPRFVKLDVQPAGPFTWQEYDWGGAIPFQGGKVWIMTMSGTNHPYFLYDLEKSRVEGELQNGGALFFNADLSKVFCEGPSSAVISWKTRLIGVLNKYVPRGFGMQTNRVETFWILDLKNNSAQRVGNLSQMPGTGSRWLPSPGFRYGYTRPTTVADGDFILCDLEEALMDTVALDGELQGWWDEQNILVKDTNGNFELWDVVKRRITPLFSREKILTALKNYVGLTNAPAAIGSFSSWNGTGYDFYFFSGESGAYNHDFGTTFLLKADRATKKLQLHSREFRFGYLGKFNQPGTLYAYNGERGASGRGGNGAVHLRDLRNNSEREIVPVDNSGQYALPRLSGESLIFRRNKLLWRQEVNGTNAVRLLPDGK